MLPFLRAGPRPFVAAVLVSSGESSEDSELIRRSRADMVAVVNYFASTILS